MYEMLKELIKPELLMLIPVLYFVGIGIKKSTIPNCVIPFLLGGVSVILCMMYIIATSLIASYKDVFMAMFTGVTQGVLCAGASVYVNQLIKQYKKTK